jgi:hypothetical protein
MTASKDGTSQHIQTFKRLNTDDQLAVLALIYNQLAGSIPSGALGGASAKASRLVAQVEQLTHEEQVSALRDLIPAQKTDQNEVVLDPHPSQAMVELAKGGNTVNVGDYASLDAESKLAFWYQIAQKLGNSVTGIPAEYHVPTEATEFVNSFSGLGSEQQIALVSQLLA